MASTTSGRIPLAKRPPSLSRRLRDARGFTIIEVAMATFVMAFGIATTIIAMQSGLRQLDLARSTTLAAQIIQSEMESVRMKSWAGICLEPASKDLEGTTYFSGNAQLAARFRGVRTITDNASGDMKDITITINWTGVDGISHTRSFTAVYAKNGLYDYYYTVAHPPHV